MRIDIYHHIIWPVPEVQTRLNEISKKLDLVLSREGNLMSAADDLNNAMTSLAIGFAVEHEAVVAELAALTAALANVTDPALTAAVTQTIANITHITGQMATDAAALTASLPAATTVPTPVVTAPAVPPTVDAPALDEVVVTDPNATPATA